MRNPLSGESAPFDPPTKPRNQILGLHFSRPAVTQLRPAIRGYWDDNSQFPL
jgi:hypothetical protein